MNCTVWLSGISCPTAAVKVESIFFWRCSLTKTSVYLPCTILHVWYRIVQNLRWCKISQKRILTLQKKFSRFIFLRDESGMLWPQPYQLMTMPHMQTEEMTTKQRSKHVQQWPSLPFARNYKSIMTAAMGEKLACWTEGIQHCWLGQLWSAS